MSLMANHLCLNALTYDLAHLQPCDDQATLWSFPGRTIELIPSFNRNVRMCMALSDSKLTFTECHSTAAQRWTLLTNVSSAFLDHVTSTLKLPALPLFHLSHHHVATPILDQSPLPGSPAPVSPATQSQLPSVVASTTNTSAPDEPDLEVKKRASNVARIMCNTDVLNYLDKKFG